jgi:AcrR family transcriptional regulator
VALSRIRQKGFEGVTVSEITREAGVAKGTFFNYFRTKDHILSEYLRRTLAKLLAEVDGRGHSGTDAILTLSDRVVDALLSDPKVAGALIPRLGSLPPSQAGAPTEIDLLRDWIRAKLGESLPVRVPLVDPPHSTSLPSHLTWALRGRLEEWTRGGQQGGKSLKKTVRRELAFLLASAGLPSE